MLRNTKPVVACTYALCKHYRETNYLVVENVGQPEELRGSTCKANNSDKGRNATTNTATGGNMKLEGKQL